jgi:nicotinate-nucleotide adenylyltransferase
VVTIPPIGIASSDLRRRLAERRSIRYMVPRGVEAYIEAQGLYRG